MVPYSMDIKFKVTDDFVINTKLIRDTSRFNIYKHRLMEKKATRSSKENFFIMIYFLYFKLSLILGTAILTKTEAWIVNMLILLIVMASVDQISRYLYCSLCDLIRTASDLLWIYLNIDKIRKLKELHGMFKSA